MDGNLQRAAVRMISLARWFLMSFPILNVDVIDELKVSVCLVFFFFRDKLEACLLNKL